MKIQKLQPGMPTFSVYQLWQRESCKNTWLWHHSMPDDNPLQGRVEPSPCLQHHMYTHNTATPCPDDSFQDTTAKDEKDFPRAPLDDNIWLEDPVWERHFCIHEVTTTWPVSLSLPIQLGPATLCSRRCTSTILWDDGPQWHLGSPRCDDNHQQWRHPWSRRYIWTLNLDYGLDKHLYSLNSLQSELCKTRWICSKCKACLIGTLMNAWTLQECHEHVLLEHLWMHALYRNAMNMSYGNIYEHMNTMNNVLLEHIWKHEHYRNDMKMFC